MKLPFALLSLLSSLEGHHLKGRELRPTSQRGEINVNYMKFFCTGDISFLPHLLVYPVTYWHQCELMDIYFILWAIIQRESESVSRSVESLCDPVKPARLLWPWDSPGKHPRVGSSSLLQGIFLTQGLNLGFLPCRQTLYHLSHQYSFYLFIYFGCAGSSLGLRALCWGMRA